MGNPQRLPLSDQNFGALEARFTREDHAHFWGGPVPDAIADMHRNVGVFAFCGVTGVECHLKYDVEADKNATIRDDWLGQARDIGRAFLAPEKLVSRNTKEEHLHRRQSHATSTH